MAYLVGAASVQNHSASTTCGTVTIPTHAANDLIVIVASQDVASATGISTATSGWTNQGTVTGAPAGGAHQRIITRLASGSGTSAPTITSTANAAWTTVCFIVRDVDTTTPVEVVSTQTDWNLAKTANSATVTPLSGECLAIYSWVADSTTQMKCKLSELTPIAKDNAAAIGVIVGYKQLPPGTTTTSAVQMRTTTASEGGSSWVVLLKNSSGGRRQPDIQVSANEFEDFGNFGTAITWAKPSDFTTTGGTINGITLSTTALSAPTTNTTAASSPLGTFTSISNADNTAGLWAGATWTFSSTDMSSRVAYLEWYTTTETQTATRLGSEGVLLGFMDSVGKWVTYQLRAKSVFPTSTATLIQSFVALGNATIYAASETPSTINWTDIVRGGFFWHRIGSSATTGTFLLKNLHLFSSVALTGGNSTLPADWVDAYDWIHGWGHSKLLEKQASAQLMAKFSATVGDGSRLTAVDMSAQALEYPVAYSATSQYDWNVNASTQTLSIYASASDVISYTASLAVTETQQTLLINSSSSTSATYSFTGTSFVGWAPTWKTGVACANLTFSGCDTVNFKGASLTNVTVKSPNSNVGASDAACSFDADGAVLTGCTINVSGSSAGYHMELGTAVTAIQLTDVTFTGAPGTDKIHVLKTTGTVTITIDGTTSLVAGDVTSEGATVVIAAPQPTLSATVLANTRVVLYNRTTDAELDNTFVAGTSWSKVITSGASANDVLDLYTFKEGYEESVATVIYSGDDASFAVEQSTDAAIQYYRTEESVTDYTTLTEFNFYSPDIYIQSDDADGASTLKRLFIFYNGVLTTEDGARYMRGGVTFRSAFDVVINRSVTPIAVDNVSTTQGLYFTDEATIRVTTDDGTSWIAPPSAPGSIRYAFGVAPGQVETGVSGLTGSESAQLMGLPSAASVATAVWSKTLPL